MAPPATAPKVFDCRINSPAAYIAPITIPARVPKIAYPRAPYSVTLRTTLFSMAVAIPEKISLTLSPRSLNLLRADSTLSRILSSWSFTYFRKLSVTLLRFSASEAVIPESIIDARNSNHAFFNRFISACADFVDSARPDLFIRAMTRRRLGTISAEYN